MSHITLLAYYQTNFTLMQDYKYSLTDIEEMMPYERDLYIDFILDWLDKRDNARHEAS